MRPLAFLLFLLFLLLAAPPAAEASEAERTRLTQEMGKLVARGAWKGADRAYTELTALEGAELSYDEHLLGAQIARTLGNTNDTHQRLKAAEAIDPTEEVYVELAQLFAAYGLVEIRVTRKAAAHELSALELPFDGAMVRTIEAARDQLRETRRYQGLLPLGRYRIGEHRFDVIGEPLLQVKAK